MSKEVRDVIRRLGLAGAIEVDDADTRVWRGRRRDENVSVGEVAVGRTQIAWRALLGEPADRGAQLLQLAGKRRIHLAQVFEVVALRRKEDTEIETRARRNRRQLDGPNRAGHGGDATLRLADVVGMRVRFRQFSEQVPEVAPGDRA